jgi:hypothetical protein
MRCSKIYGAIGTNFKYRGKVNKITKLKYKKFCTFLKSWVFSVRVITCKGKD